MFPRWLQRWNGETPTYNGRARQEIRSDAVRRKGFLLGYGIMFLSALSPGSVSGQNRCDPAPVALVLSGGGAKGFAHIGVIETLERSGIRPALIVGTSMGAIVGGLYASGYPARVIDSLARALPLTSLFKSYEPSRRNAWGSLLPLVVWEQGERGFALQTAAVRETEINALINAAMLRGNLLARGDFDRLPIPYRAVATDLRNRQPVVLAGGDLAQAVRASAAIPLIFPPEVIDRRPLIDGGLSANIPVRVARQFPGMRVIVSDVTERPSDSLDVTAPIEVADQLLGFLFQQPRDSIGPAELWIRPPVDSFRSLDFSLTSMGKLIAIGQTAAEQALGTWPCRLTGVTPLSLSQGASEEPAPNPLPRRILARFGVNGNQDHDRDFIGKTLPIEEGQLVDPTQLRIALIGMADMEPYRAVWLGPGAQGDSIAFDVTLRHAPRRVAGLGLAYDNELGGRIWLGLLSRLESRAGFEVSGVVALGTFRRDAQVALRRNYGFGRHRTTPMVSLLIGSEDVRAFTSDGSELDELDTKEVIGFAGVEQAVGGRVTVRAGLDARWWRAPDRSTRRSAGGVLRVEWEDEAKRRPQLLGELVVSRAFRRLTLEISPRFGTGRTTVQPTVRIGWGEDLPLETAFPLGGNGGFPGLHLGERRGDREVFSSVQLSRRIRGPVAIRVLTALGRTASGESLLGSDGWLGGVRAGIGAETPIGLVAFDYGVATNGRGAAFVRVGRWF